MSILGAGCSREAKIARYVQRGDKLYRASQYEQAEVEYLNVLRLDKTNRTVIRNLGLIAYEQGRLGPSYSLLTEAKKNSPDDFEVRLRLAQCLLAGGGAPQAREEAVWLVGKQPQNEEALRLLVESSAASNQLLNAAQQLEQLKPTVGNTAGYQVAWGMIQLRARDYSAAEESFRKALALAPKSSAAHVALGNAFAARHLRTEAEAEFKLAAETAAPRSPHQLPYLDFKLSSGQFKEARPLLEQAAKAAPDFLPVQTRLAQLDLVEDHFTESERRLNVVLGRDPTHLEALLLRARLCYVQDQGARAVTLLQYAVREYPRVAQVHYQLALANLKNGDQVPLAVNNLGEALRLKSDFPEATLLLAELNLRRGDATSAISALTQLVAKRPELPAAHLLLAAAYRGRGNDGEALRVYENLARIYPANPQIPLRAGMLVRQQGRTADARKLFDASLSIDPNYFPVIEQLVSIDLAEKRFDQAKERARREIRTNPAAPASHVLLAKVHVAEANFTAAETELLEAIRLAPETSGADALLANVYVVSGRKPDALRKLQGMVARSPGDVASWAQIARLQTEVRDYPAARIAYEKIIAASPQYAPAYNNLAWLYSEYLNEPKLAYEAASKARRLRPQDPIIADTLGWALYQNGEFAKAVGLLRESAEKLPDNPQVGFHRGMAHYMMGEEVPARAGLRQAALPGNEGAWRNDAVARLRVLDIDPAAADASAIKELEALGAQSPQDPVISLKLGACAERTRDWNRAAACYEKALKVNPNLTAAVITLAKIYTTQLDHAPRALELARLARQLDPGDPVAAHLLGRHTFQAATTGADYERAFSLLQESSRKLPNDRELLFDYAWAAYAVGQVSEAVEAMRQVAAERGPIGKAEPAAKFLRLQMAMEIPAESEQRVTEANETPQTDALYVPALMVSGAAQERKRDWKGASETYEKVLKRFPLFVPAMKRLAALYSTALNDSAKAFQYANRAREALPRDPEVARLLGLLEYDRGRFDRAAQLLLEATQAMPADAEVYYRLGIARHKLNQPAESRAALKKGLELAPTSGMATYAKLILAEKQ